MKKFNLLFATLILSCGVDAPPSDRMVSIGSHRLQIHREGTGSPTIVIDSGIGDGLDKLGPFQDLLSEITHVITYNRSGYGASEAGPLPRHCGREADELKSLLENASVSGPYVIVGHSLGALNAQVFAARYPDDVAGLVLLDPPPLSFILGREFIELAAMAERMTEERQGIADSDANSADVEARARADFFRMMASEHREMFRESASLVSAISTFGAIPMVVMAAGRPNPAFGDVAEEFQKYWIEQSRALTLKSSNGEFVLVEKSSHALYLDAPELVAERILSVVREVREK